eukprot:TRINITY_DN15760_c0_g1_i1.p1 TRINITY_DN15760_c0_g1~~TRINITY_DN15760_c0_g1_i1.p1  ORF type:complete len:227 (-),score=36.43 TRINITY_DN15760_c0_g1_i1:83-763(-)
MSKFRVHAVLDGSQRSIELERRRFSFNDLRSQIATKFGTNSFSVHYSGSRGNIDIQDDNSFQHAVKEALSSKAKFLNVTVSAAGGYKPPAAASHQAANLTKSANKGAGHGASHSGHSAHGSAAVPPGSLANFHLSGSSDSSADRVVIKYTQEYDHFYFTAQPSQFDTTVAIVVSDPKKLQFLCTWSFHEGGVVKSMQAAQTFHMPFDVTSNLLHVQGNSVRLDVPR